MHWSKRISRPRGWYRRTAKSGVGSYLLKPSLWRRL